MLEILKEFKGASFEYGTAIPMVHCKAFEDNTGAIKMARLPKMVSRTEHMNIKYHQFRDTVIARLISIHHVTMTLQLADILTKTLTIQIFEYLRKFVMGW
jgi:hypothetical protein